jgi:fluoroacetyl-CoA thioesterase
MLLSVGLRASVRVVVGESDTAVALGSGDVPVLGTPRLLALAEAATVAAVAPQLARGETTVGTSVTMEHRRASPVGSSLVIEAELTEVDGPRLVFSFIARRADSSAPGSDPAPGDPLPAAGAQALGAQAPGAQAPGAQAPGAQAPGADTPGGDEDVVGAGTIERVVVTRERFLARAAAHQPGAR